MVDIAAIIAAASAGLAAGKPIREAYDKWRDNKPTEQEGHVLFAAIESAGVIHITKVPIIGLYVKTERWAFLNPSNIDDSAYAAKYVAAFERLCQLGMFRHESGNLFRLRDPGYLLSQEYFSKSDPEVLRAFALPAPDTQSSSLGPSSDSQ